MAPGPNSYQADPFEKLGRKTTYINMVICHAISKLDELTYFKFMKKMNEAFKNDPKDKTAQRIIRLFAGQDFVIVKDMYLMKRFREAFNEALSFAIETKREVICFDLVIFAR